MPGTGTTVPGPLLGDSAPPSATLLLFISFLTSLVSRALLSCLLYDSLFLSAWKTTGFSTWSLRINPSSSNLHLIEAHLLSSPLSDGDSSFSSFSFLARYSPKTTPLSSVPASTSLPSSLIKATSSFSLLSPSSSDARPECTVSVPSVTATTTSATPSPPSPSSRLPSAGMPASSTASATTTSTSFSAYTAPTLRRLPSSPSAPFVTASPGSSPSIQTAPSSSSPSAPRPLSITLCSVPPCPAFCQWSGSGPPILSARTMFARTSSTAPPRLRRSHRLSVIVFL